MRALTLDNDQYQSFIRVISILKDICNDVDIRGGIARQRSNNNSAIFEINLSSLITDFDLPITVLKDKLDLFKSFIGGDVTISSEETYFSFSDQFSKLDIMAPLQSYIDNKFMNVEDLGSATTELSDEQLVLSCNITKIISDRIKTISQVFHVASLQILLNGENANLSATTQAKDQTATFLSNIILERPIENSYSNLVTIPFIIDHDGDIQFKMYNISNDDCVNKFSTTIGDVTVNIYSRSKIRPIERS